MEPDFAAAAALCVEFEGFFGFPYDDLRPRSGRIHRGDYAKGTVTIGYGETDRAVLDRYLDNDALMTEPEARSLLERRMPEYWAGTRRYYTTDLTPNQGAALTSIAYNAGGAGLARYAPETVRAINERRFADAAELIKTSVTRDQTGNVSAGLARRRAREAELFATPYQQEDPFMSLSPEQATELYDRTKATNDAVGRIEIAVRDQTGGLQAQMADLEAKLEKFLAGKG